MFNRKSSYALNKKDPNAIVYMDANEAIIRLTPITKELCGKLNVDLQHIYIDGSKFEANANKYIS